MVKSHLRDRTEPAIFVLNDVSSLLYAGVTISGVLRVLALFLDRIITTIILETLGILLSLSALSSPASRRLPAPLPLRFPPPVQTHHPSRPHPTHFAVALHVSLEEICAVITK